MRHDKTSPESRYLDVVDNPGCQTSASLRLHYLLWPGGGRSTPVVLLHGGGAHAHWWRHMAQDLAGSLGDVAALDQRGHGDSDHSPSGCYEREAIRGDVVSMIDSLGGEVDLVGASLGGIIGIGLAAAGAGVRRLVVIDSPPELPELVAGPGGLNLFANTRTYGSLEEAVANFRPFPPGSCADPALISAVAMRSYRDMGDGQWRAKFDTRMFAGRSGYSLYPLLERISCPTLYVRGEHSQIVDQQTAERIVSMIPDAELVTMPGAHHHVHLDQADELLTTLIRFLS